MDSRKKLIAIHRAFMPLMFIALAFGGLFLATNNLDFIIYAITFGRAYFPNVIYWITKTFGPIIFPLLFIVPSAPPFFQRIKAAKYAFIIYGLLHIMALGWTVMYVTQNGFDGLFSNNAIIEFQKNNALVTSLVFWGTYSWTGTILSVMFGLLCIYTGLSFDENKRKVCILLCSLTAFRLFVPIAINLIHGNTFNEYAFWITNNYAEVFSFALFTAAIILAARMDISWISLIWDQDIPHPQDDEDKEENEEN